MILKRWTRSNVEFLSYSHLVQAQTLRWMPLDYGNPPPLLIARIEPGATTDCQLAELLGDLIRHSVQFLMTLTVRLIEER